jgi:hypothetical protein
MPLYILRKISTYTDTQIGTILAQIAKLGTVTLLRRFIT